MKVDPIEDAAHPTGTHAIPGEADGRPAGDTNSGEEEIVRGRNPTQRKIDAEAKGSNAVASGTESEEDEAVQRLAENEQEQPRTAMQKIANAIEDMIPGDGDGDGH